MILIYLLKVSACTILFFAAYQFLLLRLTFFKLNRLYLLFALILSFAIPAITIENKHEVLVHQSADISQAVYSNDTSFEEDFDNANEGIALSINWNQALIYLYYTVFAALLLKALFMIGYVRFSIQKYTSFRLGSLILVKPHAKIKNCSFFNKIIIDESLLEKEKALVIKHESIHVTQVHAFDKLLINLATCILWFNPIIYFWQKAIDHNHEFLADHETSAATNKRDYATLLLNLSIPNNSLMLHSFSKLPLKNRIKMMYKAPNSKGFKLLYLFIIPVIAVCCMAFVNRENVLVKKVIPFKKVENAKGISKEKSIDEKQILAKNSARLVGQPMFLEHPAVIKLDEANLNNIDIAINRTIETVQVNTPLKAIGINRELILVVDAGHGGKDGATKSPDGIKEKDLNLRAAKILKEEAEKRKINVVLTRDKDIMIPLRERLPSETATAFISIHYNSTAIEDNKKVFNGIEVLVSKVNPNIQQAESFGMKVLNSLRQLNGVEVRDSLRNMNGLLARESKIPALVLELGNIQDAHSVAYTSDDQNLRRIANLILDGFIAFAKP